MGGHWAHCGGRQRLSHLWRRFVLPAARGLCLAALLSALPTRPVPSRLPAPPLSLNELQLMEQALNLGALGIKSTTKRCDGVSCLVTT